MLSHRHKKYKRARGEEGRRETERDRDRDRQRDRQKESDWQASRHTDREGKETEDKHRQRRLRLEKDEECPDRHVLTITINFNFDSNSADGDHHAPGRVFFIAGCNNPTPTPYTQKPRHQTSKHSYNPTPSTQKPYGTRQQGTAIIHLYRRLPLILSPHWHHWFVKTIESQKTLALGASRHQYLERTCLFQIPKESASNHTKTVHTSLTV